jgi:hypothetical protein
MAPHHDVMHQKWLQGSQDTATAEVAAAPAQAAAAGGEVPSAAVAEVALAASAEVALTASRIAEERTTRAERMTVTRWVTLMIIAP